ncbi:MAG: protein-P-II uridylyltransferase [Planctomycetaceae bacterium]|nr:protein-P-II uridylyltransferase [Planctomycetaceae bacterium]
MSLVSPALSSPLQRINRNRTRVGEMREELRRRFQEGADGISLLATFSDATDKLVLELFEEALSGCAPDLRTLIEKHLAVVAVGGSGRGEMCPFSDVDLLFLYTSNSVTNELIQQATAQLVRDLWDGGMKLGHSVRTFSDAVATSKADLQFATSLVEIRTLWGNAELAIALQNKFSQQVIRPRQAAFIDECVAARQTEFQEHGGTVQQLQPDVKKSAGGLRDLHLLKWVGFARFKTADLGMLRRLNVLSKDELHELQQAHEFLARIRVDLHLAAGRPQDVLSKEEQYRIALERGFEELPGQHPVVQFMQQYFQHTSAIARIVKRFFTMQRPRTWSTRLYQYLMQHRANDVFLVGLDEIDVQAAYRETLCGSLEKVLQLYELASLYRVNVAPLLEEAIGQVADQLPDLHSVEQARLVQSIFQRGAPLGGILRSMYRAGILEKVIPEFRRTRCLLQFNQYHHYTVDEHTLRAIEAVTSYENDAGPLGEAYRAIQQKEVLHLAVLLHDVGKGGTEDHSELGRVIAGDVAQRLRLTAHQRDNVMLLVQKHLLMPDVAFRRNIADPEVYLPFSRDVGSPEVLRMLFVLSAADITAVGPETWTGWKAGLMSDLYQRVLEVLSGESVHEHEQENVRQQRMAVHNELTEGSAPQSMTDKWVDATFDTLPRQYVIGTAPGELAAVLRLIHELDDKSVHVRSTYDPLTHTVDYRVIARDQIGSGCFSKMAGALTAKRLDILSAKIATSSDGVILDSFRVVDYDFSGPVPESRMQEVATTIQDVLLGRITVANLFESNKRHQVCASKLALMPTRVTTCNDSSGKFTIIDVFAIDRTGLLYVITKTLVDLNLSVSVAVIGTHIDQVLDVFYVTDRDGKKIRDEARLETIRDTLQKRIEAFQETGVMEDSTKLAPA